jgi:RNA polymerase sigma-70 factor (ECF subfamily)
MTDYAHSQPDELLRYARQRGDVGPLMETYRAYLKTLARIQLRGRLPHKLDASDVVQEVLLRACSRFEQFQGTTEQELLVWLRKVLASVLSNLLRQFYGTKRRAAILEQEIDAKLDFTSRVMRQVLPENDISPSEHLIRKERAVLLADAIEQLPEDYREVIVLRHIEQLTFPEVAAKMERSVDSVRKLWPRALVQLRSLTKDLQ